MSEALKPCECGSSSIRAYNNWRIGQWQPECLDCGRAGPRCSTKAEALAAWNLGAADRYNEGLEAAAQLAKELWKRRAVNGWEIAAALRAMKEPENG